MGVIQADLNLYINIDPTYNRTKYYKILIFLNESITDLIETDKEINILSLCVLKTLYLSYFNINSKNLKFPINSLIKFNNIQQNYHNDTDEINKNGENNSNLLLIQIWKKILIRYNQIDGADLFDLINNDKEFEYLIIIFISYSISSCIIILENFENKNSSENLESQLIEEIDFYNDLNNISDIVKRKEFSKLKKFSSLNKTSKRNNVKNQQDYEFFNENYRFNIIYEDRKNNDNVNESKKNKLKLNNIMENFIIQQPNDSLNSMINVTYLPDTTLFENYGLLYFENDDFKNKIFRQLLNSIKSKTDELNRILLFHGSPGTGKTSLSKSISNLICCYLNKKGLIIEILISQLFSTYINQSDKNLDNLFNEITKYCQTNKNFLVFLLIDEIESIVRSREFLINSNKDSKLLSSISNLQIVNTMLINLDKFKKINNLIMLTTTNLINNLDNAFLDRCDLIIKFEKPNLNSIFNILRYKINELLTNKILKFNNSEFFLIEEFNQISNNYNNNKLKDTYYKNNNINYDPSIALYKISEICFQLKLSNRVISKLVLNTLSDINQNDNSNKKNDTNNNNSNGGSIDIIYFLNNLVYYIIDICHNRNGNDC